MENLIRICLTLSFILIKCTWGIKYHNPLQLATFVSTLSQWCRKIFVLLTSFVAKGWAYIAIEIPGTGDCPALASDPNSADRLFSSILEWLHRQDWVDKRNIIAWGTSIGGYYSLRLAHTHREQVTGVIAQGPDCHYMFDPEWLDLTSHLEYAFE